MKKANRAFLDHERPILSIEDVDLLSVNGSNLLKQVVVAPFFVTGAGGGPCTVFVKI